MNRIFVHRQTKWIYKWILHFANAVNIIGNIISAITELAQCMPVKKLWDPEVEGSCWPAKRQQELGIFQGGEGFLEGSFFVERYFADL